MCSYQTLFHDDNVGYVVRCNACEHIQVGFGNLMLTLNCEEFNLFRTCLEKIMQEQSPEQMETLRCIAIPTSSEGVKLLLSLCELRDFYQMLEDADNELQSASLLKLFEQT